MVVSLARRIKSLLLELWIASELDVASELLLARMASLLAGATSLLPGTTSLEVFPSSTT
ncbi:MAG: hypothetical protein MJY99_03680 [Fibrobacter sp.]|nr:hypothetical protein [Fibrobacter sp.]